MTTTRSSVLPLQIIEDITQISANFNEKIGKPIKEQQDIQDTIIKIVAAINQGFRLLSNTETKITPGSQADAQIKLVVAEICGMNLDISELQKNWENSVKALPVNAQQIIDQTTEDVKSLQTKLLKTKSETTLDDMKTLLDKANDSTVKLASAVEYAKDFFSKQEAFKTKVPLLIKKATSDLPFLKDKLQRAGYNITKSNNQDDNQYQANKSVTLHGKSTTKAQAPEPAAEKSTLLQQGKK